MPSLFMNCLGNRYTYKVFCEYINVFLKLFLEQVRSKPYSIEYFC